MGNSKFWPAQGRGAATGVFSRGYVENKGLRVAPQVGFEPTTLRLTAETHPFYLNWPGLADTC